MNLILLEQAVEKSNNMPIIIGAIVVVLLLILVVVLVSKKKKTTKQTTKVKVDDVLIQNITKLFTKDNVLSVESEVSRVKFEVKDLDLVNLEEVKKISNGVFVTGNNVKVMFKDSADEIVNKLNNYYK